jgi:hypothetical protein
LRVLRTASVVITGDRKGDDIPYAQHKLQTDIQVKTEEHRIHTARMHAAYCNIISEKDGLK